MRTENQSETTKTSPKGSPVRVYLDTNDYSRFADIGHRKLPEDIPSILDFLREKKARGLIEVRFSYIHLVEFLKDPSQRTLALRKVQIIEELCGDFAFRYISDVFDREREALRSGTDPRALVVSDEGEWFPETMTTTPLDLDVLVRRLLEKFPSLSKAQLEAMIQNPQAIAYLKANMAGQFPLANAYGSDLLDRFLSGKLSGLETSRELAKGFANPRILITHYLEGNAAAHKVFGILATAEEKLHAELNQVRDKLKEHIQSLLGLDKEILKEARQYVRTQSLALSAPYLGVEKLSVNHQEALEQGQFLKELPALSTHLNVLAAYLRDIIYPSKVMPEIKQSDGADILHATYLPYVDLYRTDGRFGALLSKVPKPRSVKVIPNLLQLPEAIEKELASRVSSPPLDE